MNLSIVIFEGLLTTTFLMRACAAHKPVNFIIDFSDAALFRAFSLKKVVR